MPCACIHVPDRDAALLNRCIHQPPTLTSHPHSPVTHTHQPPTLLPLNGAFHTCVAHAIRFSSAQISSVSYAAAPFISSSTLGALKSISKWAVDPFCNAGILFVSLFYLYRRYFHTLPYLLLYATRRALRSFMRGVHAVDASLPGVHNSFQFVTIDCFRLPVLAVIGLLVAIEARIN